jgi:hypothetical protein
MFPAKPSAKRDAWPKMTARSPGVTLKVLDIERPTTALYGSGLAWSRPDQHVAWRGDASPADSLALIDRVRGAANQPCEAPDRRCGPADT